MSDIIVKYLGREGSARKIKAMADGKEWYREILYAKNSCNSKVGECHPVSRSENQRVTKYQNNSTHGCTVIVNKCYNIIIIIMCFVERAGMPARAANVRNVILNVRSGWIIDVGPSCVVPVLCNSVWQRDAENNLFERSRVGRARPPKRHYLHTCYRVMAAAD